jgi:hypothetical protein
MSKRTESAHTSQEQSPTPHTPDSLPTPAPDTAVEVPPPPVSPEQPPDPAGADPAALLKAFAREAKSAATAALRMGQLATDYISARMLLSDACQRDACVKSLVSAWQEHSDDVVTATRVNALIRTAAAWNLFNAATGHKPGKVALRVVREFAPLCERDGAQRAETWRVVPALADKAHALWAEATGKGLNGEEVAAAVAQIIAEHKAALAEEASKAAAAPGATPDASKAADKAAEEASKAAESAETKRQRAGKAPDDAPGKPPAKDATPAPKPEAPSRGENLLVTLAQSAKQGTAKDFASLLATAALKSDDPLAVLFELAAAVIAESNTPDDALRALVDGAKSAKNLSRQGARAADAALILLSRSKATAKAG